MTPTIRQSISRKSKVWLVYVTFHAMARLGASTTLRTRDGFTPAEVAASNVFEYLLYISLQARPERVNFSAPRIL